MIKCFIQYSFGFNFWFTCKLNVAPSDVSVKALDRLKICQEYLYQACIHSLIIISAMFNLGMSVLSRLRYSNFMYFLSSEIYHIANGVSPCTHVFSSKLIPYLIFAVPVAI